MFLTKNKLMTNVQTILCLLGACIIMASGLVFSSKERSKYVPWVPLADKGLGKVKGGGFLGLINEIHVLE